ncbi:MAG TPA: DUF1592 domain-containing protein [Polyangiaceae bacterium]|nr:DUF1592 domain-containing protein [Polyangiaceae bacterium]
MKPLRNRLMQAHERDRASRSILRSGSLRGTAWMGGALLLAIAAGCSSGKIGTSTGSSGTGSIGVGGSGPGGPSGGTSSGAGSGGQTPGNPNSPIPTGTVAAPGTTGTTTSAVCTGSAGLTSRRVRRLAEREYANIVNDLLGATAAQTVATTWPQEPTVGGFDNQDAALFMSASLMETVSDMAATLAAAANPTTIAPCATTGGSTACLQSFTSSFAAQAYGRPLSAAEVTEYNTMAATGQDYATSVRLVVEMVLQSPYTLWNSELGPDSLTTASTQPVPLTQYEIASQISLLLRGSRPDATLTQAAAANGLSTTAGIQAQVDRLLPTAAGQASLSRFIEGWIENGPMSTVPKDPTIFAAWTPAIATAMQQEYDQFVTAQLKGGNGTLSDLLTGMSTNIPAALAPIYGADLLANGTLDPTHRKGILSLPAVLTYTSSDSNSGPVERGLLVRRGLFCQTVQPPPASLATQIAATTPTGDTAAMTTRQQFEAHVANPVCSSCHNIFDPIGFGMEDMDGLGRYRITENGLPVDASGALTATDVNGTFTGTAQLSASLAKSADVQQCMVQHFFSFAQLRDPAATDQCVINDWTNQFTAASGKIASLVAAQVANRDFIYREDDR